MDELVNYCKQYGFVFQGSEIYGGLANSWDYGSLGRELKNNIKKAWWQKFIQENTNIEYRNYGLDSAILMNPEVWVASGHVASFADPLIDCKKCKSRERADKLIEEATKGAETGDGWDNEKLENYIKDNHICCPKCGACDFTPIRKFNLLFETHMGVTEDNKSKVYLRGETAQGIFVNWGGNSLIWVGMINSPTPNHDRKIPGILFSNSFDMVKQWNNHFESSYQGLTVISYLSKEELEKL